MPPCTWMSGRAHRVQLVGRERLRDRGGAVALGRVGGVGGPARVVGAGAGELDGAEHVGAEVLDGLERADRSVELPPLLRVLDGHLERPRRGADAVDDRSDAEAIDGLGDRAASRCRCRAGVRALR